MKALIRKLVEIPGPSGYETQIRNAVRNEVETLADEIIVDNLGNLIARLGEKGDGGLKIMLAAHIDEIGVIATHIDERGFVRFLPVGGVRPHTCLGGRVLFLNGSRGVIGAERLTTPQNVPGFDQMYIDLGATTRADCPVKVGDMAVFERPLIDLGQRLVSKALDDRIGAAVLIETMKNLRQVKDRTPHEIYFVFSVQEEVGDGGARTAAYRIDPEIGLAVDVTGVGDTPRGVTMEVALGKGPAIKVRDQGLLSDPRIVDWMVKTAVQNGIPYQLEILQYGWTDASAIQLTRAGVPAGCLSLPCRYVHSPSEMVDTQDVQYAVQLLTALLKDPIQL